MIKALARVKEIRNLRGIWENEAEDFTRWLAMEENLNLLSETIGVDLELIKTEAEVGRYNVDILAKESTSGRYVVIENQIEPTDHDHLGKLLTYAAGYDAALGIWIVREAKEEHAKAVEWLNEHTDDDRGFFLLEIKVLQIGDSLPAPQFRVIVRPNEWARAIKSDSRGKLLTDTKQRQLQFWSEFSRYLRGSKEGKLFSLQRPAARSYYDFRIGTSLAHLTCTVSASKSKLSCIFYIRNNHKLYDFIYARKEEIEDKLKGGQWWKAKKDSGYLICRRIDPMPEADSEQKERFKWLASELIEFRKVFQPLVKEFGRG